MKGSGLARGDELLLKSWYTQAGLSKGTVNLYTLGLKKFSYFNGMSLEDLLEEAEDEEENGVRKRRRKIGQRIGGYRESLEEEGASPNTIKTYLMAVKSFYQFHDVTLPKIKIPKGDVGLKDNYGRIPTREDILKMCNVAGSRGRAILYLLSLTGMSGAELLRLTVEDFIGAAGYSEVGDFIAADHEDIITLHITREKVHYRYFTFCPPEAISQVVAYLVERLSCGLDPSSGRLIVSRTGKPLQPRNFRNTIRGYGYSAGFTKPPGVYAWWRAHSLRKYFISTIKNKTRDVDLAEYLAGHKKSTVERAYWYPDEQDLLERYKQALPYLSLDGVRVKDLESEEYQNIKKELNELKKAVANIKKQGETPPPL